MKIFFPIVMAFAMESSMDITQSPLDHLDRTDSFGASDYASPYVAPSKGYDTADPYPSPYSATTMSEYSNPFVNSDSSAGSQETYEPYYTKPDDSGILKYYLKQTQ